MTHRRWDYSYRYQERANHLGLTTPANPSFDADAFDIAVEGVLELARCQPHKIDGISGDGGGWHRFDLETSARWWLGCDLAERLGLSLKEGHNLVHSAVGSLICADWDEIPDYIAQAAPARRCDGGEANQ